MAGYVNPIGRKFGRLTVIAYKSSYREEGRRRPSKSYAVCECGKNGWYQHGHLTKGHTQSCGCLQQERASEANSTHGMSDTKVYHVWLTMVRKCTKPQDQRYEYYGARGIKV